VLLVLGFGVKAGMLPVHTWLPNAHPAAPSPASALLSGVIIKAGAYGIFRTVFSLFRPALGTDFAEASWDFTAGLGLAVLWIGLASMAVGVVLALGQRNAKRMLAYHSISQMGFILAGLGAGAYLGGEGALGTAGGLMHAVNHALFKASLFLGVGAVALRTGQLDMYALGGLWRRMPVTFGFMLLAAAGITGVPLFNGFVSKCMIHHALEAAYAEGQTTALWLAQWLYMLVCAGTAASFIKLIGLYYLGHYFLSAGDIGMSLVIFALGGVVFAVGMRYGLFHLHLPAWLGIDYWLRRAGRATAAAFEHGATGMRGARGEHGAQFLGALRGVSRGYHRAGQQGGGALGELLLLVFQGITFLYGQVQQRVAWLLRAVRRRFLLGMGEAGLARRQLVESVLVGQPGSPAQSFLEAAWGALEQDRHATVRAVLVKAAETPAPAGTGAAAPAEGRIEAARALAGLMSGTVFEARLEGLGELARERGDRRCTRRLSRHCTGSSRSPATRLCAVAVDLAEARSRGEDITREVSQQLQPVLEREARAIATAGGTSSIGRGAPDQTGAPASGRRREAFSAWLLDLGRLAVAEVRQHPSSWPQSESLDTEPTVVSTRRGIQRYSRATWRSTSRPSSCSCLCWPQ
jgi:hypothetical protein